MDIIIHYLNYLIFISKILIFNLLTTTSEFSMLSPLILSSSAEISHGRSSNRGISSMNVLAAVCNIYIRAVLG
jgi:CRISPR/Cas system endoribonuclease Cas6 (RAMP superfamily)